MSSMSFHFKIRFKVLCDLFEKVRRARASQKYEELKKFFNKCREKIKNIKEEDPSADTSFFPIMRFIMPTIDRERGPFGLKEKALASLYIQIFCLGKNSQDAQKLLYYRIPTSNNEDGQDFADRVYSVLNPRLRGNESAFSIGQIDAFLNNVAAKNATKESKNQTFLFIRELSAIELKWLTRIILKDLRLGIGQKKIFNAFHPEADAFFDMQANLREVCDKLTDPSVKIGKDLMRIQLFSHFRPMLLERCKIENVEKLFHGREQRYFVQTKYDGERSQMHVQNGRFKYFTRQGFDITNKPGYGETQYSGGFLTKNIMQLLNKNCHSVILDGELMGWHKELKKFGSKGMSFDVKHLSETSVHQPCFVAFDVILYNEQLLIDKPYFERLNILNNLFKQKEGVIVKGTTRMIDNSEQLLELFNKSLDNNDEGIVLKKYDFTYKPNVREGSGCYKLKAEYSENLIQDVDMIILGGYYGEGQWTGIVNSFLVGIATSPAIQGGIPSTFHAIVSVSSGISHQQLRKLQETFKKKWKKRCPTNVIPPRNNLPDMWIDPKDSLVIQLRATEIIKTKDNKFGYTMRFPRIVKFREDKLWYDVCSTTEFMSFVKDSGVVKKLTKRHATFDDIETVPSEKTPKVRNPHPPRFIMDEFYIGVDCSNISRLTRLLQDKEFCVINGDNELSKTDIQKLLYQHGAKITQNPRKETFCVIIGNPKTLRAKNIIRSGQYDIVSPNWLKKVTKKENWSKLQDFYPWELLSCKRGTKKRLDKLYDQFYDSFMNDADEESLKMSLEKAEEMIEDDDCAMMDPKELDKEIFENGVSSFSVFRGKLGYFHDPTDVEKYSFRLMSGTVVEDIADATYVFVSNECVEDLHRNCSTYDSSLYQIVNSKWIADCFMQRALLPFGDYLIYQSF